MCAESSIFTCQLFEPISLELVTQPANRISKMHHGVDRSRSNCEEFPSFLLPLLSKVVDPIFFSKDVSNNKIESLPHREIAQMVSLLTLNVTGNPLSQCTYLPAGVISPDGNFIPASISNACTNLILFTTKALDYLYF